MATNKLTPAAGKITSVTIRENAKKDHSPKWDDAITWSGEYFTKAFHAAMKYYNLNCNGKDLKPKVVEWMSKNEYTKEQILNFKNTKDSRCNLTMGAIASCLLRGMPVVHDGFNAGKNTAEWLIKEIADVLTKGAKDKQEADELAEKAAAQSALNPASSSADRLKDEAMLMTEELDAAIDDFNSNPDSFDPKSYKVSTILRSKGVKHTHIKYIKAIFQFEYNELTTLVSGKADDQLREAYSHLARKYVKKLYEFYVNIFNVCDQFSQEAKTLRKPRTKKVKPAEELVKGVKFRVTDDKLGIASVHPKLLIGAQHAIVYNVVTRKLGLYIASSLDGLTVKGSALQNFKTESTHKTLRNPAEQIKTLKEMNTLKRFETWYKKSVTTVELPLTGRLSEDIVILKVFK